MELTKEIYWKMRGNCDKGLHKFRDNKFGVTWCIVYGHLATKSCGRPFLKEEQIITSNLK
jgi:hypothetical protein